MAVACQCLEVFRFPVMQSTFCFPNIEIIAVPATSLINYFRPKGAVESVFVGKNRQNCAKTSWELCFPGPFRQKPRPSQVSSGSRQLANVAQAPANRAQVGQEPSFSNPPSGPF